MLNMRYKSFVWPNNPRTYTLSCKRQTVTHKVPMGGFVVQDLGVYAAVMQGQGEFYGEGAYEKFQELLQVFQTGGAGLLVHPVWQAGSAYFTQLRLTQEPREDYVAYSFEFCQASMQSGAETGMDLAGTSGGKRYCELSAGQTLWAVCAGYGLSMAALLKLNPEIAKPGSVFPGQRVRVQ